MRNIILEFSCQLLRNVIFNKSHLNLIDIQIVVLAFNFLWNSVYPCNYDCHVDSSDQCLKCKSTNSLLFIHTWTLFHYSPFEFQCHARMINNIASAKPRKRFAIISTMRCSSRKSLYYAPFCEATPFPACNKPLFFYGMSPNGYFPIWHPATRYWLY